MRDESFIERAEKDAVAFLLEVRRGYMRQHGPHMKIYTMLEARIREACQGTSSLKAWCTRIMSRMQVSSFAALDARILPLVEAGEIDGRQGRRLMRRFMEDVGYLIALLRVAVEEERERRSQGDLFMDSKEED